MKKSYDKHLNIFMTYGTDCRKENNITKAFINTLMYADNEKFDKIEFLKELIGDKHKEILEKNDYLEYDLQNPVDKEEIKKSNVKKVLIGLSPFEEKGIEYFDIILKKLDLKNDSNKNLDEEKWQEIYKKIIENKENEKKIEKEMDEQLKDFKEIKKELKDQIKKEIQMYLSRGGSIPDAWIYVYDNEKKRNLKLIIAIETKLWKLDNSQLLNHIDESLGGNAIIKYRSFEYLISKISEINNNSKDKFIENFLQYMEILGYNVIEKFSTEDMEYVKQSIDNESKEYDMLILSKKWEKIFREYKKIKKDGIKFLEKNNRISIGNNSSFNLTYEFYSGKKEKYEAFIALEIGVKLNEKLIKMIKDRNETELIEIFGKNDDEDTNISYDIYRKITRQNDGPNAKYYRLNRERYKVDECVKKLKNEIETFYEHNEEKERIFEIIKKDIKFKNEEDLSDDELKSRIGIVNWKEEDKNNNRHKYNLLTYLRFVEYISYDKILKEENIEKQKNKIIKMIDEIIERQISRAKKIEEELKKIK